MSCSGSREPTIHSLFAQLDTKPKGKKCLIGFKIYDIRLCVRVDVGIGQEQKKMRAACENNRPIGEVEQCDRPMDLPGEREIFLDTLTLE